MVLKDHIIQETTSLLSTMQLMRGLSLYHLFYLLEDYQSLLNPHILLSKQQYMLTHDLQD